MDDSGKLEKNPEQQKEIEKIKRLRRRGRSMPYISSRVSVSIATVHKILSERRKRHNGL